MPLKPPDNLRSYSAPSSSSQSSSSESYDYSGLDEHIKKQDTISQLRDAKFASLYGGDVAGSVTTGNKIRDLLTAVRAYEPAATERDPVKTIAPLVRVSARSNSNSSSFDGGNFAGDNDREPALPAVPPPEQRPNAVMGVDRRRKDGAQVAIA